MEKKTTKNADDLINICKPRIARNLWTVITVPTKNTNDAVSMISIEAIISWN